MTSRVSVSDRDSVHGSEHDLDRSRDEGVRRECRVRHCAGTTIRYDTALRTMALPGSPREAR